MVLGNDKFQYKNRIIAHMSSQSRDYRSYFKQRLEHKGLSNYAIKN